MAQTKAFVEQKPGMKPFKNKVDQWLTEDGLMLLECWTRDGYSRDDIATKIGVASATITGWAEKYPDTIGEALRKGREIVDYKVENALLKSALGFKTTEVKITTTIRGGKVIETIKETTNKEFAPSVAAIQMWLYNRKKEQWRNMNNSRNLIDELSDEDTSIKIEVVRAGKQSQQSNEQDNDNEWEDMNQEIRVRKATEEEMEEVRKRKDLDYWPEDWDEDDEEVEENEEW